VGWPGDAEISALERSEIVGSRLGREFCCLQGTYDLQLMTENRTTLVDAEIHAGDGAGDHIFLNLNQVAVGVRHGQHCEHILATRNNH